MREGKKMKIPSILLEHADFLEKKMQTRFPALSPLAKQCFLNTIETTVKCCENGDYFVITGDIPALWLRDSAAQLRPYLPFCKDSEELREIIRGVIRRHCFYVALDPYANAFNEKQTGSPHKKDKTDFYSDYIWERKYETDSLCASVYLAADYDDAANDPSLFSPELHKMLQTIIETIRKEQHHNESSEYFFHREGASETDSMPLEGKGNPVGYTGMTWSGFRPSDDRCKYNYLIPANMMCVVAMRRAANLLRKGYGDEFYAGLAEKTAEEIEDGIRRFGIVKDPDGCDMYAYETDGLGNYLLMDDANSPSLLSLPYIGYCKKSDPLYLNTRKILLSENNPYYHSGKAAAGIGSPHTKKDTIWHISIIMQILTSEDEEEIERCLHYLANTHAGTNFMHESFHMDDPTKYSRSWFAWANALFSQMLETL